MHGNLEHKDPHTLFCQVGVSPVTQSFQLRDDKQKSSQSSEEMPFAKQTGAPNL